MTHFLQHSDEAVILSSGQPSHWFVDGAAMYADPFIRESVLRHWETELRSYSGRSATGTKPWHFVPVPSGGDDWAREIAERMDVTWGYADGSTMAARADQLRPVIVEDVLTTGASVGRVKMQHQALESTSMLLVVARRFAYPVTATWIDLFNLD